MKPSTYDVIIVGGGIMGCSVAYNLKCIDRNLRIAIIEKDPTYTQASTTLSLCNVRIQFSFQKNIEISQYALNFIRDFSEIMSIDEEKIDVAFRPEGNLFLFDETGESSAKKALALQKKMSCQAEWWSPKEIQDHFPLYRLPGIQGGIFSPGDGYLDAYTFLMAYKNKAINLGTRYHDAEVTEFINEGKRIDGVKLHTGEVLHTPIVVNSTGAWATNLLNTIGINLPVDPIKRQVFVLNPAIKPEKPLPLTNLPSGLYFRTEGDSLLLVGKSLPEDPREFDFTCDPDRFTNLLWPELATVVPDFDRVKLVREWAGLYAVNTFDGNAILGEWPNSKGLFLINGFSGHGLQQAPAAGLYLAQLITQTAPTLDLSVFGPERILENRPILEDHLV
jgi:glycine/D-amino acid oxidase-like deaminating enzyme